MPLPEHEQRQLQEIERALCRDDPAFARLMRAAGPRARYARTLIAYIACHFMLSLKTVRRRLPDRRPAAGGLAGQAR